MGKTYIIESRNADGSLELKGPQPETVFGLQAITGISEDAMAKVIFARSKDAVLEGTNIPRWPSFIHPTWKARVKTW